MLILERSHATGRAQGNLRTTAFQLQCVARFQLQFFPHRLGDNDAACFVHSEPDIHIGMITWVDPLINAICGRALGVGAGMKGRTPVDRILVSGASGLIGTALLSSFAPQETEIVRLVRGHASNPAQISWDPLARLLPSAVS